MILLDNLNKKRYNVNVLILTDLYVLPEGLTFSQINCCGCEALPENHGLDATIWNLTNLENPRLK